jgi:hypothetical protein
MSLWSPAARDAYRKSHPSLGTNTRIDTQPRKIENRLGEARQPQQSQPARPTGIWSDAARDAYVENRRQEQLKEKIEKFAEQLRDGQPPLFTDCFDVSPTGRNPNVNQR